MYIDVIKLDVNEFCSCVNLKGMRIIWSYLFLLRCRLIQKKYAHAQLITIHYAR